MMTCNVLDEVPTARLPLAGARRGTSEQTRLLPGLPGHRRLHRPHLSAGLLQALRGREP